MMLAIELFNAGGVKYLPEYPIVSQSTRRAEL